MSVLVGVDIGGTFTDFVTYDRATDAITVWKNPTTPAEPIEGVLTGLARVEDKATIEHLRLGTTIATNAILERRGAEIAYVTTKGFRDIPFIQRGNRRSHYDMAWIKTKPLVKRRYCFELDERLGPKGEVLKPVNAAEVRALARQIKAAGDIEAIAVTFLFSYVAPEHEREVRQILAEELPGMPISISYDVLPKWKEYERASTTIADAYLKPLVGKSLATMQRRFGEIGIGDRVVVIKSNGGEATLDAAAEQPVQMAVSGPTGGVVAARIVARLLDIPNLVTLDMGGTSTDCSTVIGGHDSFTTDFEIEWGVPIQVPMIDIRTIGAGGGSIAWIDKGGMLRVGPQSAGAVPGPACYGHGGTQATVTDANLVLGRINKDNFLGGAMALDAEAATAAIDRVAAKLGIGREETALAVVNIANNNMVGALRTVLLERGLDPRDFTLLAFGGAGPLHLADLMDLAGIPQGMIPNHPGQFSAFGFIMTDARVDKQRTIHQTSRQFDQTRASQVLRELLSDAIGELRSQGYAGEVEAVTSLDLRYLGQNYELQLPYARQSFDDASLAALWAQFHQTHERRFGFAIPGETIELVHLSVAVTAPSKRPTLRKLPKSTAAPAPSVKRPVRFQGGWQDTPVYQRGTLLAGQNITGPAIIEEAASVTVLPAGRKLAVDDYGNLRVSA